MPWLSHSAADIHDYMLCPKQRALLEGLVTGSAAHNFDDTMTAALCG